MKTNMEPYNCTTCTRTDCPHREAFRRLPRECGGLDLCPGHVSEPAEPDNAEIVSKIEALKEWEALQAECAAEIEALKDAIKKEMDTRGVEELPAGQYIARFTTVLSNRFDSTTFKREHAEMYKQYTKQTTSRRFSVA